MSLDAWLFFCATETVLCLTPGPAVLLVVSQALGHGGGAGLRAGLGVLTSNALYFALSATSVGALLLASYELFFLVKWLGAAYLVWIGLRSLLRPRAAAPAAHASPAAGLRPYLHGVVTQGANPKTLVFFSALLPQFIDPGGPVAQQVAILGASSIAIELGVLALYAAAGDRARRAGTRPGLAPGLERLGGLLLVGAGAGLATLRRTP